MAHAPESFPSRPDPEPQAAHCPCDPGISAIIRRQGLDQDGLIEVLHAVQQLHGHLSRDQLRQVAQQLQLPLSRVYGVASFYHLFRLQPSPPHRCEVCLGTACFVRGADQLLAQWPEILPQLSLSEGTLGLEVVSCLGSCAQAPLMRLDGAVIADPPLADPQRLAALLKRALTAAGQPRIQPAQP